MSGLDTNHSLPDSVHAAAPQKWQSKPEVQPCLPGTGEENGGRKDPWGQEGRDARSSHTHLQAAVPSLATLWHGFHPWRVPQAPTAAPTDLGFSPLSLKWPQGPQWTPLIGSA